MWALVKNSVIENIIELTNPAGYQPPVGMQLVEISVGGIGWGFVDGQAVEPAVQTPTETEIIKALTDAVQRHLDAAAGQRNYDGILSLASYAGDPDPVLNAEGLAGKAWRSACWKKCYSVLAECKDEEAPRPVPTAAELIAELPPFVWPE